MARKQQLHNQDEIIEKIQAKMLETLQKETLANEDFHKLQYLSLSLRAVSESTRLLQNMP
ncbi:MAG TPA: hypothetical protein V6D48_13055 [Oculatellaceae cyanobacterium]